MCFQTFSSSTISMRSFSTSWSWGGTGRGERVASFVEFGVDIGLLARVRFSIAWSAFNSSFSASRTAFKAGRQSWLTYVIHPKNRLEPLLGLWECHWWWHSEFLDNIPSLSHFRWSVFRDRFHGCCSCLGPVVVIGGRMPVWFQQWVMVSAVTESQASLTMSMASRRSILYMLHSLASSSSIAWRQ